LLNTPQIIVGDASDLVYSNPFDYSNKLSYNNVTTNLPSNDESSTFGAFFMAEMERLTTVKTITDME